MSDSTNASNPQRIVVLGGGRVGSAIARDLAKDDGFRVTVADHDDAVQERLAPFTDIAVQSADLGDRQVLHSVIADADLVVGAVPGWMGYQTLEGIIEAGKNVVDISFFEEDPAPLDALAKEKGVTAVMDCGVAPGLSNLMLGHWAAKYERIDRFVCLVGGLPQDPEPPWNYKAPYSPSDVIEMYTRPARMRRGGKAITLEALSEPELLDFPGVGTLEAFNTDGSRTLMDFEDIPDLVERTLRYPGHREYIALLRDGGFFDRTPRQVGQGAHRAHGHDVANALRAVVPRAEGLRPHRHAPHRRRHPARPAHSGSAGSVRPLRPRAGHLVHGPHHRLSLRRGNATRRPWNLSAARSVTAGSGRTLCRLLPGGDGGFGGAGHPVRSPLVGVAVDKPRSLHQPSQLVGDGMTRPTFIGGDQVRWIDVPVAYVTADAETQLSATAVVALLPALGVGDAPQGLRRIVVAVPEIPADVVTTAVDVGPAPDFQIVGTAGRGLLPSVVRILGPAVADGKAAGINLP